MTTATKPPRDLGDSGRALWRDVQASYAINDPAGLALLEVAARAVDRMAQARDVIAGKGLLIKGGRANPAIKIEVDARNGFLAAMRALHLDIEPLRDALQRGEKSPFQPSESSSSVVPLPPRSRPTNEPL